MDKTVKLLILTLLLILSRISFTQNWVTIDASNYHPVGSFIQHGTGYVQSNKQFLVNQYNNSIWFAYLNQVQGFDPSGNYFYFDDLNTPLFDDQSAMIDFACTPNYTFVLDRYFGIHKYDGVNWTYASGITDGVDISSDQDTVWIARQNDVYVKWEAGTVYFGDISNVRRIKSKNGIFWKSSSWNSFISLYENSVVSTYSPDTCFLLDWTNYNMKFSKNTDSLYVAGFSGISVAINGGFTDTIIPDNTIGMPSSSILEIELDSQNNIWAVFGTDYNTVTHVGYLDRSLGIWTQMYDNTNSPIDFSFRVSIELDSADNLYVVDGDLHVLQINVLPQWLKTLELEKENNNFDVYPNPSNGNVTIKMNDATLVTTIEILDVSGRLLNTIPYKTNLELDLDNGFYVLRILNSNVIVGSKKIIIE